MFILVMHQQWDFDSLIICNSVKIISDCLEAVKQTAGKLFHLNQTENFDYFWYVAS